MRRYSRDGSTYFISLHEDHLSIKNGFVQIPFELGNKMSINEHTIPFALFTMAITGGALAVSFIASAIEERLTALEIRTNELTEELREKSENITKLTSELEEKTTKLTDIRAKLTDLLEGMDEDYSDMPPLVKA